MQAPPVLDLPHSDGTLAALLISAIAGIVTLILTNMFTLWRDSRNRKWDKEDRELARKEAALRAQMQRTEMIYTAAELAKLTKKNRDIMIAEIERNTELTQETNVKAEAAFREANNFNQKIENLKRAVLASGAQLGVLAETTDSIAAVTDDTNIKVTEMKGDADDD